MLNNRVPIYRQARCSSLDHAYVLEQKDQSHSLAANGGTGGHEDSIVLDPEERITNVTATYGAYLDSIQITNYHKQKKLVKMRRIWRR
jgi:hypothetical protein